MSTVASTLASLMGGSFSFNSLAAFSYSGASFLQCPHLLCKNVFRAIKMLRFGKYYVLIDRKGGTDGNLFGPRSWCTDQVLRGPCAMTEDQIFSCRA